VGDAVVATDTSGKVTFENAIAEDLTGWPHFEALDRLALFLNVWFEQSTLCRKRAAHIDGAGALHETCKAQDLW